MRLGSHNPSVSSAQEHIPRQGRAGQYTWCWLHVPEGCVSPQSSTQCPQDAISEGSHAPGPDTGCHIPAQVLCSHLWPLGLTAV